MAICKVDHLGGDRVLEAAPDALGRAGGPLRCGGAGVMLKGSARTRTRVVARTLSEILRRFRPAVAPGPAGPAGVPADRVAEARAELADVFVALEPAVTAARQMRERARADADRRRQQGVEQAERIRAEARGRLDAVRAEAASVHLAALDVDRAALEADARSEAERVQQVIGARLPRVVAQVIAQVWDTGGLPATTAAVAPRDEVAG